MQYRAEIDSLRALAVIPVNLFHAEFVSFSGGFVSVDGTFVYRDAGHLSVEGSYFLGEKYEWSHKLQKLASK